MGLADSTYGINTITFDPSFFGSSPRMITLTTGALSLTTTALGSLSIQGTAANALGISGNGASQVLSVSRNSSASLAGLTISGGNGTGVSNFGTLTMTNCSVSDNSSTGVNNNGGGTLTMTNCTVSGNTSTTSSSAYGVRNLGTLTMTNCTVANNRSSLGTAFGIKSTGTLSLMNTLVALNTGGTDVAGAVVNSSANLIGNGTGLSGITNGSAGNRIGTSISPINPVLGGLGYYGGTTLTMALLVGSPAIDAGDAGLAVDANGDPLTTDQRGFARISTTRVDIGAYEVQKPALPTSLATATYGAPYSQTITATETAGGAGGPYTYAVTAGTLPAGLSLTSAGVLSGTPTAAGKTGFTITATDAKGYTGGQTYSFSVLKDTTTTALTASANPTVLGQSVTFTATVAPVSPGSGIPTGTVQFKDGTTVLATVPLTNGVATYSTSTLSQGTHSITAVYSGDANDLKSTSAALSQQVQSGTTTTVSSSNLSATFGTAVTFTVTLADIAPGIGIPTGTVLLYDGTTLLGTLTLVNGVATLTTSSLSVGTHRIKAVYQGDTNHQGSTSSLISQVIK